MAVGISRSADPASVAGSSNVVTYSGVSIGTAAHDRIVALTVTSELASITNITATADWGLGDISSHGSSAFVNFGSNSTRIFIWHIGNPATTATFKITWTGGTPTANQNHICVYNVTGAKGALNGSGTNTSTDMDATTPLTTGSSTIPSSGGMLAAASCATGSTASKTWANLTEDRELSIGAPTYCHTVAFSTTAGTATRTCTGSTNNEDGSMAWVIFDPNASVERAPAQANLILSADAPTLAVTDNRDLSPARADLVLSTTAPTLAISDNKNLTPATANLILSTEAPTLLVGTTLSPPTADLVLSTTAPTLALTENRDLSPAAGQLALSTTAPSLVVTDNRDLSPAAGQLALSTTAPTLQVTDNKDLSPAAAQLLLSGTAPTVDLGGGINLTPAAGQLSLSTTAPTLAVSDNRDLSPAAANLVLSTVAPTLALTANINVSPATAQLVLQGFAPDVSAGAVAFPSENNIAHSAGGDRTKGSVAGAKSLESVGAARSQESAASAKVRSSVGAPRVAH